MEREWEESPKSCHDNRHVRVCVAKREGKGERDAY